MNVIQAKEERFNDVCAFYHALIDDIKSSLFNPGWEKDVYPSNEMLRHAISKGELYIAVLDEDDTEVLSGYKDQDPECEEPSDSACVTAATGIRRYKLDQIVAAMSVNGDYNEGYDKGNWQVSAEPEKISVIHMLGVDASLNGRGIGARMVDKAIDVSREQGRRVIRLDALPKVRPAISLYTKMGFQNVDTIEMFYEDTGWTNFYLFEYAL